MLSLWLVEAEAWGDRLTSLQAGGEGEGLMGGSIELHLDSKSGPMIGKLKVSNTKGEYKELSTSVKNAKGVHDLYLVFKGGDFQQRNLFYLDWWEFSK